MTTISTKQFRKEDFPGLTAAEPKLEDLLTALNQTSKSLETILNGGIGQANMHSETKTIDLMVNQVYPVKVSTRVGKVIGLHVLQCNKVVDKKLHPLGQAVWIDWVMDGKDVVITPALPLDTKYQLTFEIRGA